MIALENRQRALGLTLIEVLIALLVVSVGLLGVAALNSLALRNNYDALLRSHATALADDIADRMRANPTAVDSTSEYNIGIGERVDSDENASRAAIDVTQWKDALAAQLPGGDGSVTIGANDIVTIRVEWGERPSANQAPEDDPGIFFETQTEI